MRYAYHFEFCERPELPEWLRGDVFLSLSQLQASFGLNDVLDRVVPELIVMSGARRLFELGSGSGEGLARVAAHMPPGFKLIATDLFPQPELWSSRLGRFSDVSWCEEKVSFEAFGDTLGRDGLHGSVMLLTTAFHHLEQKKARGFLRRCAEARAHVLVIEPLSPRSFAGAVLGALSGMPTLVSPLLATGISWTQRLRMMGLHWVIPVIPFVISHDGLVSALRQRTHEDWQGLIQNLPFSFHVRERLGTFGTYSAVLLKHAEL